jgi:hypothetical protein
MKKKDDYIAGSHHYWTHFFCGLVFGAGMGAWMGWHWFDSREAIVGTTAVVSLVVALSCGRWGDPAWQWIIENLLWFT